MPSSSFVSLTSWQAPFNTLPRSDWSELLFSQSEHQPEHGRHRGSEDVSICLQLTTQILLTTAASSQQAAGLDTNWNIYPTEHLHPHPDSAEVQQPPIVTELLQLIPLSCSSPCLQRLSCLSRCCYRPTILLPCCWPPVLHLSRSSPVPLQHSTFGRPIVLFSLYFIGRRS